MVAIAEHLAEFIAAMDAARLPPPVLEAAKLHALDTLGCGLAAYALDEGSWAAAALAEEPALGSVDAIGVATGLRSLDAAFVNGVLCHALDFDDTHPGAVVHVSASVVPAAFAAAQYYRRSGDEAVAAMVVGNETAIRVGAVGAGHLHERGFHPTGVAGVFGAAAAASRAAGLDVEKTAHALGIAGSMASGLLEFLSDGAQTKPIHPGWAAQAGLTAARLASHGATGPATVIEGRRGFVATYLYGVDPDLASSFAGLGTRWETPRMAYKPYAACHYTHASVDALAELLSEERFAPDDVDSITAFTDSTGVGLVLEPHEDKVRPRTPYDAKFSLPYCLSHMLVHGHLEISAFSASAIEDPTVLALADRISYEQHTYGDTPDSFGGGVQVTLKDGRRRMRELRHQRGSEEYPMSREDVQSKFVANAEMALNSDETHKLLQDILAMDSAPDLTFLSTIRGAHRAVS